MLDPKEEKDESIEAIQERIACDEEKAREDPRDLPAKSRILDLAERRRRIKNLK